MAVQHSLLHPEYGVNAKEWTLWRSIWRGGTAFIEKYLVQYSKRETAQDFEERLKVSYNPAFAKACLIDIKNAISPRLDSVTRKSESATYMRVIDGLDGGVDYRGSTMHGFFGRVVTPDLLVMGRVAVHVDNTPSPGITLADAKNSHPYLYIYRTEDILNWSFDTEGKLVAILVRVFEYDRDPDLNLTLATGKTIFRSFTRRADGVYVVDMDESGHKISLEPRVLKLKEIPIWILDIGQSLLQDIARHQVSALNLASSDVHFGVRGNFPFYVEPYDPRTQNTLFKKDTTNISKQGDDQQSTTMAVGTTMGRRYPEGSSPPAFIAPPTDNIKASMDKQEQIKDEIRSLMHLSLATLQPRLASEESKKMDNQGMENGLAIIGAELEAAERKIEHFWRQYENIQKEGTINYPKQYRLLSESEKNQKIELMDKSRRTVPSKTYGQQATEEMVTLLLGDKLSEDERKKIFDEIQRSPLQDVKPETIESLVKLGVLSPETAAKALGLPEDEPEKAQKAAVERAKRIAEAQQSNAARGVDKVGAGPDAALEKEGIEQEKQEDVK